MRPTPAEEWQRLTKLYSEMSDGELEEVGSDFANLTEIAQPILRDEMRKRGMEGLSRSDGLPDEQCAFDRIDESSGDDESTASQKGTGITNGSKIPRAYLCECDDRIQVIQLSEMLRREGIASFAEIPHHGIFGVNESEVRRIFVPADQLDEARAIIAHPVPQDIVDQSRVKVEDFVPPKCPKCGASDPILESSDPTNSWHCDDCGYDWTEAAPADESVAKASS